MTVIVKRRFRVGQPLFATAMPPTERRSAARLRKAERGIRRRRVREHTIRDDRNRAADMDAIRNRGSGSDGAARGLRRRVAPALPDFGIRATLAAGSSTRPSLAGK
jgi:hypothetical protein